MAVTITRNQIIVGVVLALLFITVYYFQSQRNPSGSIAALVQDTQPQKPHEQQPQTPASNPNIRAKLLQPISQYDTTDYEPVDDVDTVEYTLSVIGKTTTVIPATVEPATPAVVVESPATPAVVVAPPPPPPVEDKSPAVYIVFAVHVAVKERFPTNLATWAKSIIDFHQSKDANAKAPPHTAALLFFGARASFPTEVKTDISPFVMFHFTDEPNPAVKTKQIFKLMHDTFPKATWYMKLDDDTYVYTRNLIDRLQTYHTAETEPLYLGYPLKYPPTGSTFNSGGAGYLLNRPALQKVAPSLASCADLGVGAWKGPYEDVTLSACLSPHDIKPTFLRGLHPLDPDTMTKWDRTGHPDDRLPDSAEPLDSMIPLKPLSYHYIDPTRMSDMHDEASEYYFWNTQPSEVKETRKRRAIPKILHQISASLDVDTPADLTAKMQHCKELNPSWTYMHWNRSSQLGESAVFGVATAKNTVQKRNIVTYEVLYRHGGVVIDAEAECTQPLQGFVDELHKKLSDHQVFALAHDKDNNLPSLKLLGSVKYSEAVMTLLRLLNKSDLSAADIAATGSEFMAKHAMPIYISRPSSLQSPVALDAPTS